MDPKSGDPTLGSTLIEDDLALDGFLSDMIDKDEVDRLYSESSYAFGDEKLDFSIFKEPIEEIKYEIVPKESVQEPTIDSGNSSIGSLSPNGSSSSSMSPQSTYLDSPRQEIVEPKPQATITIATPNSLANKTEKRRISDRVKKPSIKRKMPRIEKTDKIPKLEPLEEKLASSTGGITVSASPTVQTKSSVDLTPEEQEVLSQNGWDPNDPKNLKKARRKIKNKISAQESRRRKRDYVSNLEERLSNCSAENSQLKHELEKEQADKKSLLCQIRELQQVVNQRFQGKNVKTATTQTSAAVMVVLLCMTIFKGSWSAEDDEMHGHAVMEDFDYTTPPYKSRVLKCYGEDDLDFCDVNGQNLPMIKFDKEDDDNDPIGLLQMQMAKMDVMDKSEYKQGTLVNIAQTLLNNNQETNTSEASGPLIGIPNLASWQPAGKFKFWTGISTGFFSSEKIATE